MCERMNDMIIQIEGLGSIHIGDNGLDGVSHDDRGRPILHLVLTLNSPSRDAHPEDGGIGFTFIPAGANHNGYHQVYEDQLPLAKRILHALRQSSLETITVRRVVFDLLEEHQVDVYLHYCGNTKVADPEAALCRIARAINNAYKQYPLLREEEQTVELWKKP